MNCFEELESALLGLSSPGIVPGLDKPSFLLTALGNPERSFKAIHLLGTNGKGSTAATLESILLHGGYRVALYTSPHLECLAERLRVDGKQLAFDLWKEAFEQLKACIQSNKELALAPPTYFENLTALAFLLIQKSGVELVILEAGMGGRLDVTNLVPHILVTLITPIGLDHCEFLGNTLSAVAHEKFSAVRRGIPAIYSANDPQLSEQFIKTCGETGAKGQLLSDCVSFSDVRCSLDGTHVRLHPKGVPSLDVTTPLVGPHQAQNLALAYAAISGPLSKDYPVSNEDILKGIAATCWAGRFELVAKSPPLVLDGAHNAHAIDRLVETVLMLKDDQAFDAILFATMQDKDYIPSLVMLKKLNVPFYLTQIPGLPRSESLENLKGNVARAGITIKGCYALPEEAVAEAQRHHESLLCIGSLFLVGYLKSQLPHPAHTDCF